MDRRPLARDVRPSRGAIGAALSPTIAGYLLASPRWIDAPFYIAGGVKIVYDLWLYRAFVSHRPRKAV